MGKIRIVQHNDMFRVEKLEECFDPYYKDGEYYESWNHLKTFTNQTSAEAFAEQYIKQMERNIPKVVKEYNF